MSIQVVPAVSAKRNTSFLQHHPSMPFLPRLLCLPVPLVNFALQHFNIWRQLWRARYWANWPGTMRGRQVKAAPSRGWPRTGMAVEGQPSSYTPTYLMNRGIWSSREKTLYASGWSAFVETHHQLCFNDVPTWAESCNSVCILEAWDTTLKIIQQELARFIGNIQT